MNGVRLFSSVGLKASTCNLVKNQESKWHATPKRLYSAFTFAHPVSSIIMTFTFRTNFTKKGVTKKSII